jgi:hypothetical protein
MLALVFALAAHLGLVFAIGIRTDSENSPLTGNQVPTATLSVYFSNPDIATQIQKSGEIAKPAQLSLDSSLVQSHASQQLDVDESLLSILGQTEPRYFRPQELSGKPFILHDVPADLAITLYGVPLQSVVLHLLINEKGDIDRVIIENSNLPEQTENAIIEAFSKTKFYPGKIGEIAVRTKLKIEVAIEDASSEVQVNSH